MKILLPIIMIITMTGCTLFQKNVGTDELGEISKEVLKDEEGLSLKFEPIKESKG